MNTKPLYVVFLLGISMLSLSCFAAYAQEDTAELSLMIGTVEVLTKEAGQWIEASEGMKLAGGDKIRTGIDGILSITFSNGSIVTLKSDTEFEIHSLNISKDKKDIDYKLKITMGKLRAIVEGLGDESSFEIETPTAVAAVRGTLFYINVVELDEADLSADLKDRLKTELFVEEGGVLYTNTASGKFFKVDAGKFSDAYRDGTISEPLDVPEDKQKEWEQGWEDILAAEPYQLPEETTVPDITGTGEGEPEEDGGERQADWVNRLLDDEERLIQAALEASGDALEAAENAHKAEADALLAKQEVDDKTTDLIGKEGDMNDAFNAASDKKDEASALYDVAQDKVDDAQQALTDVEDEITKEENKNPHFVIVDIITLRNKYNTLQAQFDMIGEDFAALGAEIDELIELLVGAPSGSQSLLEKLNQSSTDAAFWAQQAGDLSDRLLEAATKANMEANDAALEALQVLIDVTQEAIDRANQAALDAGQAAQEAEKLLGGIPSLLAQMDQLVGALGDIWQDAGVLSQSFQDAAVSAKALIEKAGEVNDDILSLVSAQIRHEKDMVWQEMNRKLREQQFLRAEIRDILEANQERRIEGYIEKIADAQMGKIFRDIHGNRVRVEQYVLRPDSNIVELLNVNLRAGDDLTVLKWRTHFNKSLDTLPTGQLKTLPWNDYLDTKWAWTAYINSPHQDQGIYPNEMWVGLSHNYDGFAEGRKLAERNNGKQAIYDRQLTVNNFNSGQPMDYKYDSEGPQPDGTFSLDAQKRNAGIGGAENNPMGFCYSYASATGEQGTLDASFYVISDLGVRQGGYDAMRVDDIWDALRVNMGSADKNIGTNNLEMIFNSAEFQYRPIDLVYVPFDKLEWKGDSHIPDYSLPE